MHGKKSKAEEAYEIIKNRIVRLEYSPGQVLNEADTAGEFSLSRTPVRNIFEQLKNKNLLNIIPRYGAQVMPVDLRYMKSVFEAVREQEVYATKLAVQRMAASEVAELAEMVARIKEYDQQTDYQTMLADDAKFHEIVILSCQNPCIIQQLFDLHLHTERFWHCYHSRLSNSRLFYDTLEGIVEAIKARDLERADFYAKAHIDAFVDTIRPELL